jgi:aminoglycoside 6'-N-acetyltransferase I
MATWRIRKAGLSDGNELAAMRQLLWPESSFEEHLRELESGLPAVNFVAVDEHESLIGFLEAGLRSHADGCDPSRPAGYIEGWFVREEFRHRGVGRELIRAAEDWARAQGCVEMASDALIDNQTSQVAHEALGYEVVDRCVHYRKQL